MYAGEQYQECLGPGLWEFLWSEGTVRHYNNPNIHMYALIGIAELTYGIQEPKKVRQTKRERLIPQQLRRPTTFSVTLDNLARLFLPSFLPSFLPLLPKKNGMSEFSYITCTSICMQFHL